MSFVNQGKPARIKSVYGHNTGTAAETVYTCPANCVAEITFIHVALPFYLSLIRCAAFSHAAFVVVHFLFHVLPFKQ